MTSNSPTSCVPTEELKQLDRDIRALCSDNQALHNNVRRLSKQTDDLRNAINELQRDTRALRSKINEVSVDVDALKEKVELLGMLQVRSSTNENTYCSTKKCSQ